MRMMKEVRRPWRLSLIIKLVGRKIGNQFHLHRMQSLWKRQHAFALIDLNNDFFITCFSNRHSHDAIF